MEKNKMVAVLSLSLLFLAAAFPAYGDGFIHLFDDKDFKGSEVTVNVGTDIPDMKEFATVDGKKGFNDRASSAKYQVPDGWEAVLYDDANFQQRIYVLKGTGELKDLSKAMDKVSSVRWEQR